jgi:hypothetical protein
MAETNHRESRSASAEKGPPATAPGHTGRHDESATKQATWKLAAGGAGHGIAIRLCGR